MTHEKLDNLYLIDLQIKFINIKIILLILQYQKNFINIKIIL